MSSLPPAKLPPDRGSSDCSNDDEDVELVGTGFAVLQVSQATAGDSQDARFSRFNDMVFSLLSCSLPSSSRVLGSGLSRQEQSAMPSCLIVGVKRRRP